jgi:predicted phosphatase
MTDEAKQKLLAMGIHFDKQKTYWEAEDVAECYALYNEISGSKLKDSGCPSCRRNVIKYLFNKYQEVKNVK